PRILYAGMWAAERKPWNLHSGSTDGGVYMSTDGGDTWKRLTAGLPRGMAGKTAVSVSAADPDRVFVLIEAANNESGLYRSDNGGDSFQRVNNQISILQRPWYYIHVYADPGNADVVYALNVGFLKSIDGGRTFQSVSTPHGDNHDLWINPLDSKKMINANDGGANVSLTGGASWSGQMNQPTAEIYRVTVDTRFPYRVYGAQQDNSTVSIASRSGGFGEAGGFYSVGGGESGHIAVDPRNPNIVYAGSYGGFISRVDIATGIGEDIRTYPDAQTGQRAADMKYRFHWNAPIRLSPHNPNVVYHTSQYVHRSSDQGKTWEVISPDLTRNDKSKQGYSGATGINRDNTGTEVYDIIFALEESAKVPGLLWVGTDDGRVHLSRDNGRNWSNITPPDMPEWGCVNAIDLSAHDPGRAHIAVFRYRQNDFSPFIFRTNDYGKTWQKLTDGTNGIPANHFVRVVREDPDRKGLLYAGTEFGMYVSFDDGAHWQRLQLNLPVTPVTDLMVYRKDLVVATQGRAFWILDDLTPLHQITEATKTTNYLMKPREAYRSGGPGANIYYYLSEAPKDSVRIDILDSRGGTVASFTGQGARPGQPRVSAAAGLNRFTWNARYPAIFDIPQGISQWGGGNTPPKVVPGTYQVKVTAGTWSQTQPLEVKSDPRQPAAISDYEEQLRFSREIVGKVKELYDVLLQLRDAKQQATQIGQRLESAGFGNEAANAARALNERLGELEGELTQTQGQGGQDALNFPGRLDNQWLVLYSSVAAPDARPLRGAYQRYDDLKPELPKLLDRIRDIFNSDLAKFNELVRSKGAQPVILKK
ncbi:MAG: glycosyl hydrolase, partial [Acidobacteria bacterium]|nr:glycosyl hydrolase [Acidobacteriota bacterium]